MGIKAPYPPSAYPPKAPYEGRGFGAAGLPDLGFLSLGPFRVQWLVGFWV